jgi:hypothetical protein
MLTLSLKLSCPDMIQFFLLFWFLFALFKAYSENKTGDLMFWNPSWLLSLTDTFLMIWGEGILIKLWILEFWCV